MFLSDNFLLAKSYRIAMIAHSFIVVRPAIERGFNEVDEVDRPQPGGAGCGCSSRSAQTLYLANNKSPPNSPP